MSQTAGQDDQTLYGTGIYSNLTAAAGFKEYFRDWFLLMLQQGIYRVASSN